MTDKSYEAEIPRVSKNLKVEKGSGLRNSLVGAESPNSLSLKVGDIS